MELHSIENEEYEDQLRVHSCRLSAQLANTNILAHIFLKLNLQMKIMYQQIILIMCQCISRLSFRVGALIVLNQVQQKFHHSSTVQIKRFTSTVLNCCQEPDYWETHIWFSFQCTWLILKKVCQCIFSILWYSHNTSDPPPNIYIPVYFP